MGKVLVAAISRIGDSKTYVLLIIIALLALFTCIIAAAIFGQALWDRFFDLLIGETVTGGVRAVGVDGAPKIAAAWRNPDSQAANPPSAMLAIIPPQYRQSASSTLSKASLTDINSLYGGQ